MKWYNYENRKQSSGYQGLRQWEEQKGNGSGYKKTTEGLLWWQKYSLSWLYQWQYPDCDTVLYNL